MGQALKPKFNDILKVNPRVKYLCSFSGEGIPKEGQYGMSWMYTLVQGGVEYVYFANQEYHAQDIDRAIQMGNTVLEIEMVPDLYNGKTVNKFNVTVPDGPQPTSQMMPRAHTKPVGASKEPNWDEISRGKCRHAYAVELFKALLAAGKTPKLLDEAKVLIEEWTNYSMGSTAPIETIAKNSVPLSVPDGEETLPPMPF